MAGLPCAEDFRLCLEKRRLRFLFSLGFFVQHDFLCTQAEDLFLGVDGETLKSRKRVTLEHMVVVASSSLYW
jgi:hypothetical protein